MRYWTFLIAASRQFDYRPAICPDFVKSGRRDFFRRNLDSRSYASEGKIHAARIEDSELGPVELFYVTEFVRDADSPQAFVYDDSGRRFYFTHGIVAKPDRTGETLDESAAEQLIASQRGTVQSQLKKFLASEHEPAVMISRAVKLDARASEGGSARTPPAAPPQGTRENSAIDLPPRRGLRDAAMVALVPIAVLSLLANGYFAYADYFDAHRPAFWPKRYAELERACDARARAVEKQYQDVSSQRQAALADLAKTNDELDRVTKENAALRKAADIAQQKKPGED